MSNEWDFYRLRVDDMPASIMVDLGIRKSVPDSSRPYMGYLRMQMLNPRSDGLSSQEEFENLCDIGDSVDTIINSCQEQHIYVGRNTSDGNRDFYFYTNNLEDLYSNLNTVINNFPEYNFETGGRKDAEWDVYRDFLYPRPIDLQRISNRRVCDQLLKHGDDIKKPRPIDHRVYFSKKSNLVNYESYLSELGFEITNKGRTKPLFGEYYLDFKRNDIPDNMDDVLYEIFLKSIEFDGEYDGWGCNVVSPSEV